MCLPYVSEMSPVRPPNLPYIDEMRAADKPLRLTPAFNVLFLTAFNVLFSTRMYV